MSGQDANDFHQKYGIGALAEKLVPKEKVEEVKITVDNRERLYNKIPPLIMDYVEVLQKETGADKILYLSPLLVTISAHLNSKIFISDNDYYEKVFPNIWIVNIAESGQLKSTAMKKASEIAFAKRKEINKKLNELNNELELMNPKSEEYTKAKDRMIDLKRLNPVLPDKTTNEAFLYNLGNGCKGALFIDEFGSWLNNGEKNAGTLGSSFKGLLIELFDPNTSSVKETKTKGSNYINSPYVSMYGIAAPVWIKENLNNKDVETGFLPRILLFTPPKYKKERCLKVSHEVKEEKARFVEKFSEELRQILNNVEEGREYSLSEESILYLWGTEEKEGLLDHVANFTEARPNNEILKSYINRWRTYILKISIIMQLFIDYKTDIISKEALEASASFVGIAMKDTMKFLGSKLGNDLFEENCEKVNDYIKRKHEELNAPVGKRDIRRSSCFLGKVRDLDEIIEALKEAEQIEEVFVGKRKSFIPAKN